MENKSTRNFWIISAALVFMGFGCARNVPITEMQKVSFQTSDKVTIIGNKIEGDEGKPVVLLLHMMPATKEGWQPMQLALKEKGWGSLAIDLRGHGESTYKGNQRIYYQDFEDSDHQASGNDVDAATQYLKENGADESQIVIVGASIGANLALRYAATHHDIPAITLLSPGLDYRGVATLESVRALSSNQSVLMMASDDDAYSFSTVRELYNAATQLKARQIVEGSGPGHGTAMIEKNPQWIADIITWFETHTPPFQGGVQGG